MTKVNRGLQTGFSLLEIAIALTIIGVLLYGVAGMLNKVDDFDTYQANQQYIEKVEDAYYTYIQVNRYLPCPDTDADGRENRSGTQCTAEEGSVPYLDLGISPTDAWDARLYYAVNTRSDTSDITDADESASYFSNATSPIPSYDYNTDPFGSDRGSGNYRVCSETATACSATTGSDDVIEFAAIAVVISFGKNADDTWAKRAAGNENLLSAAEEENADDDNHFWQDQGSDVDGNEFDDQLFWITGYDMKYAVVKSGGGLPELP